MGDACGELSDGRTGDACADRCLPGVGVEAMESILQLRAKARVSSCDADCERELQRAIEKSSHRV